MNMLTRLFRNRQTHYVSLGFADGRAFADPKKVQDIDKGVVSFQLAS